VFGGGVVFGELIAAVNIADLGGRRDGRFP
jgi:hypothetical protein